MRKAALILTFALFFACGRHGTRYVRVTELVMITEPGNLLQSDGCRALWVRLQQAGIGMDTFGENWNEVVIDSAHDLIEKGCVQEAASRESQ